jgi:hypothetical protein
MKIRFKEDGSFLEFLPQDDGKLSVVLYGVKDQNTATMSYVNIDKESVVDILMFLTDWMEAVDPSLLYDAERRREIEQEIEAKEQWKAERAKEREEEE